MSSNVRRATHMSLVQVNYHTHVLFSKKPFDFLHQFLPLSSCSNPDSPTSSAVNPIERRRIAAGLSRLIKSHPTHLLVGFSRQFCPIFLAQIMELLGFRDTAFSFFKASFSDENIKSCCIAAHLLAAEDLRFLAQDVVTFVIERVGVEKGRSLAGFMWGHHWQYESSFSILDTLMRSFCRAEMGNEALVILGRMRELNMVPSSSAIGALLWVLIRTGDYGSVWKLLREMLRSGPKPSLRMFKALIDGFCQKGLTRVGESLLFIMRKFNTKPDVNSYNMVIRAHCLTGPASKSLDWIKIMADDGVKPSVVTLNTIITALCREGNVKAAARLFFQGARMFWVSPDNKMFNSLIDGYMKARKIRRARSLHEKMKSWGVLPDGITFNILVGGHYKFGTEEDLDRLLSSFASPGLFPEGSASFHDVSIGALCWAARVNEAEKLLQDSIKKGLPLSLVAFNSIIAAHSWAGSDEKAFRVYEFMIGLGLTPSTVTCNALVTALTANGKLQEAEEFVCKMTEMGFLVNNLTALTVIMDGHFRAGDQNAARGVWDRMVYPGTVAYSAYITGLSRSGLVHEAHEAFYEMLNRGLVPNNFAYNSLIRGYCEMRDLKGALELESEMRRSGLVPDIYTVNLIIHGFCRVGKMKSAMRVFTSLMGQNQLRPDAVTFNTLIGGYCKALDLVSAEDMLQKMSMCGSNPDIFTFNTFIHSFCRIRKTIRGAKLLDRLVSEGIVPDTATYNTLLNGACFDVPDRALVLMAKLLKMNFVPDVVTANMLLSHFCKKGVPERALMWGQKLSEISFGFDEITFKILARAYHKTQRNNGRQTKISGQIIFLDTLMYITYSYFCSSRLCREETTRIEKT